MCEPATKIVKLGNWAENEPHCFMGKANMNLQSATQILQIISPMCAYQWILGGLIAGNLW